jgi:hypothetical protein
MLVLSVVRNKKGAIMEKHYTGRLVKEGDGHTEGKDRDKSGKISINATFTRGSRGGSSAVVGLAGV